MSETDGLLDYSELSDVELIAQFHAGSAGRDFGTSDSAGHGSALPSSDAGPDSRALGGAAAAFAELYRRHHEAGRRVATKLAGPSMADELVAEAFARILELLRRGKGPRAAFRTYLGLTVRSLYVDHVRVDSRHQWVGDDTTIEQLLLDPGLDDGSDARFEASVVTAAFKDLPPRWRTALWLTTVEGLSMREAGELLGLRETAVRVLSFRAREGLRRSYLRHHMRSDRGDECRDIAPTLPAYVRGGLKGPRVELVEQHLAGCADCAAAVVDLGKVNSELGALLVPAFLGVAAWGYRDSYSGTGVLHVPTAWKVAGATAVTAAAGVVVLAALIVSRGHDPDQTGKTTGAPANNSAASSTGEAAHTHVSPIGPTTPSTVTQDDHGHGVTGHSNNSDTSPRPTDAGTTSPRPSNPTPTVDGADLAIGSPQIYRLGDEGGARWFHLTLPVTEAVPGTRVDIAWTGVKKHQVHEPGAFGDWSCHQATTPSRTLTCILQSGTRAKPLGLDVLVETQASLTATALSTDDPHPHNNSKAIKIVN